MGNYHSEIYFLKNILKTMRETLMRFLNRIRNSLLLTVVVEEHVLKSLFTMKICNQDVHMKCIRGLYSHGESQLELRSVVNED